MVDSGLMEVNRRPLKIPKLNKGFEGSKSSSKQLKLGEVEDDEYLRQFLLFHYEFHKSEGFTVDWEQYDYAFHIRSLDTSPPISDTRTNADVINDVTLFAIEKHNEAHGTKLVFVEHVSANFKFANGLLCWLTFWATDMASSTPESKIYQVKVWRRGKEFKIPIFRIKPKDEEMDYVEVEPPTPMPYGDYDKPPVVFVRAGLEDGVPFVFYRTGALLDDYRSGYNDKDETSFEFVEVEKANIYKGSRYTYFITFVVTDRCLDDNQTKIFQAKVRNVICREIVHSFCRPKPDEGGDEFEFVEVEKVNIHLGSGYIYFITFVVKDDNKDTKIFQAKVRNVLSREIAHSFCRPKPIQEVKYDEDYKNVVKKRRYIYKWSMLFIVYRVFIFISKTLLIIY